MEPDVSPVSPISLGGVESSLKLPLVDLPSLEVLSSLDAAPNIPGQDPLVQQQIMQILPDLLAIERIEGSHEPSREANSDNTNSDNRNSDTKREAIAALPNFEALPQTSMAVPLIGLHAKAEMQSAAPENVMPESKMPESVMPSLPQNVMIDSAEGEDALWQDLARLIEVSTEDMVRASLSGDFSAFESINFDALPHNEPMPVPLQSNQVQPIPEDLQPTDIADGRQDIEVPLDPKEPDSETEEKSFIPALSQPSWPSPVVYPLRSTKKPRSSGVDLPSFLRPGADPLPT